MSKNNFRKLNKKEEEMLQNQSQAFQNDVAEGLTMIEDAKELEVFKNEINRTVKQRSFINNKNKKRDNPMKVSSWILILLVLALIIFSYLIIYFYSWKLK